MNTYHGSFYPCYRNEKGQMRETTQSLLFKAENDMEACEQFALWANLMFETLKEHYKWLLIGCIKIHSYHIEEIQSSGECKTRSGFPCLMEWKVDMGLYQPKNPTPLLQSRIQTIKNNQTLKPS